MNCLKSGEWDSEKPAFLPNAYAFGRNAGYGSRIHPLALVNSTANFERELVNFTSLYEDTCAPKRTFKRQNSPGCRTILRP